MDDKNMVLSLLIHAKEKLLEVYHVLTEDNSNGNQNDYVTNPRLSNEFDQVEELVAKIDKIIYQK
jgi:hypothetical protein